MDNAARRISLNIAGQTEETGCLNNWAEKLLVYKGHAVVI